MRRKRKFAGNWFLVSIQRRQKSKKEYIPMVEFLDNICAKRMQNSDKVGE